MPTLDGVNVKRLDHPEGPGVLLEAREILLTLADYVGGRQGGALRDLAATVDCDLAISDRTLFGATDEMWPAHDPRQRETPPMPTSEAEWAAHVAFYRLTVAQRDGAWRTISELESAYKRIAREAADLLSAAQASGAAAMFEQAAEEGFR